LQLSGRVHSRPTYMCMVVDRYYWFQIVHTTQNSPLRYVKSPPGLNTRANKIDVFLRPSGITLLNLSIYTQSTIKLTKILHRHAWWTIVCPASGATPAVAASAWTARSVSGCFYGRDKNTVSLVITRGLCIARQ